MRRTLVALGLGGLYVLGLAAAAAPGSGVGDEVRRTSDVLLQADTREPGDVHAALRRLIGISGDLGREARLPATAQAKLDAAAAEARRSSPLDEAVRAFLLTAADAGNLEQVLEDCGYEHRGDQWVSPDFVALERYELALGV